jgi:hypothetical protein
LFPNAGVGERAEHTRLPFQRRIPDRVQLLCGTRCWHSRAGAGGVPGVFRRAVWRGALPRREWLCALLHHARQQRCLDVRARLRPSRSSLEQHHRGGGVHVLSGSTVFPWRAQRVPRPGASGLVTAPRGRARARLWGRPRRRRAAPSTRVGASKCARAARCAQLAQLATQGLCPCTDGIGKAPASSSSVTATSAHVRSRSPAWRNGSIENVPRSTATMPPR